jgi:tetratricopeptide (TPR) repeat protein
MDALTELEILPPHEPKAQFGLNLLKGVISFFHRDEPGRIRAVTRGVTAGVEGTEFVLAVAGEGLTEKTTLYVIDGKVRLTNAQGTLLLINGEQAVTEVGSAPLRTVGFIANNVLQWCFYYPAVLDLLDLPLDSSTETALAASLDAYRSGDLLAALRLYPAGREPGSDAEKIYYAELLLSVGQVARTEAVLSSLPRDPATGRVQRLAAALRRQIAAVKRQESTSPLKPELATEFLASSYYEQSLAIRDVSLKAALRLADRATTNSPTFAFALERVAELQFSFGRTREAMKALDRSLELAPRNAQARALKGFLLAAQNRTRDAIEWFNESLAVDSGLGNAWLGRGLSRIRRGDLEGGREDLLVAAALEPQRALLRSYLGKAYGEERDYSRAISELRRAETLDPKDPTAWLYSALLKEQQNRINEAIHDLEVSQDLNQNREVYRSGLLLDQDRGVRSANLARIYAEAGLDDVGFREAGRAVAADYANYSAHLFLANSYAQLTGPNPFGLRFRPSHLSEYLLASMLGPADGRVLSQGVSQQEYTRLFERDTLGLSSSTEYLSRGAWSQSGAQYGTFGGSSYAVEGEYLWDPGETPNGQLESWAVSVKAKQMLSLQDGLYLQVVVGSDSSGDLTQRYNPNQGLRGMDNDYDLGPNVLAGLDHQWNENNRTLVLFSQFKSDLDATNPHSPVLLETQTFGRTDGFLQTDLSLKFREKLTAYSGELQHIMLTGPFQTIAGVRIQRTTDEMSSLQAIYPGNAPEYEIYFGDAGSTITNQSLEAEATRISPYLYEFWQVIPSLQLIGGLSYDYQELPTNTRFPPVDATQHNESKLSPKAGLVWTPSSRATLRGVYSQSLGGFNLEQSVRLEPTQLAGFGLVYRDLIPPSLLGVVSGDKVETADLSFDYRFPSRTYVAVSGEFLESNLEDHAGGFQRGLLTSQGPALQFDRSLKYQERSLDVSAHQLLGEWFSIGASYRLSEAQLDESYPGVPASLGVTSLSYKGLLHTLKLQALAQHPSGLFAGFEAVWWSQQLSDDLSSLEGDSFWQENLRLGYRFPRRRAEISAGILNLGGSDYQLHPINLYPYLPRSRTLFVRLQLNF